MIVNIDNIVISDLSKDSAYATKQRVWRGPGKATGGTFPCLAERPLCFSIHLKYTVRHPRRESIWFGHPSRDRRGKEQDVAAVTDARVRKSTFPKSLCFSSKFGTRTLAAKRKSV